MDEKEAAALLRRYQEGNASGEEIRLVEQWYRRLMDGGEWHWEPAEKEALEAAIERSLLQRIQLLNAVEAGSAGLTVAASSPRIYLLRRLGWIAAAVILLFGAGVGSWLLFFRPQRPAITAKPILQQRFKNDVTAGGNRATLTLASGAAIPLDSMANGMLALQGNTQVKKMAGGRLVYMALPEKPGAVLYNTLTTPRGGQYQLSLPDGSTVWLNAASSIRYPVTFSGNERIVEISGEVYFEIAPIVRSPFKVKVRGMEVGVLGTQFNINAYGDETVMKTTLLEGAVRISNGGQERQLRPGQQAVVAGDEARNGGMVIKTIGKAEMEEVMAWKDGLFRFNGTQLENVMRQIARWYDVTIDYKTPLPAYPFVGKIPRNVPASEILKLLELTDVVHFTIEGKKITVFP